MHTPVAVFPVQSRRRCFIISNAFLNDAERCVRCVRTDLAGRQQPRARAATQQSYRYRREEEREAESRAGPGDSLAKGVVERVE